MLENLEASMNNIPLSDAERYNPNALVTYKKIAGTYAAPESPEYITDKVVDLEWTLHNARQTDKSLSVLRSKVDTVKDIILEAYADSEDQETLTSIAEALDIELTRDVEFTATVEVSGTITLNLLEDYDLESEITDALYVDAQNGNIVIDEQEVCHVREA
jgi:hypothetical protein